MATFDWEVILKAEAAFRNCCNGEAFGEFRGASSDADCVAWCCQLVVWSEDIIGQFIQKCVEASCTESETSGKSEEQSKNWREKGNVWFKTRRYNEALLCYSRSILTAPCSSDGCPLPESVALATAFGNRSAALYHLQKYELAIQECDRAMNHSYPRGSLHKILLRKGQCLIKIGLRKPAATVLRQALLMLDEESTISEEKKESLKSEIKKLLDDCSQSSADETTAAPSSPSSPEELSEPSDQLENASRALSLQICKDRGRYLVADVPVRAGKLLIKESPYAVVLLPDYHRTHCHQCCSRTLNPIPCPTCIDVLYCSDQCKRSAWDSHHWLECGLWEGLMMFGTQAWLSLRILLQAKSWHNAKCVAEVTSQQTSPSTSSKHLKADPQTSPMKTGEEKVTPQKATVMREEGTSPNAHGKQHLGLEPHTSQTSPTESVMEEAKPRMTEDTSPHNSTQNHIREEPQSLDLETEDEVERNNGTSLPGCDQDGCYRSNYRAVYHLMPHTKNHSDQQLFNMAMTALLLSRCVQQKLLSSTQWMHCTENIPTSTFCNYGNLGCVQSESRTCQNTTQDEGTVMDTPKSCEESDCGMKCDCNEPRSNQLENFPVFVRETAAVLLRHLQQLSCNSHAVTAVQTSEDSNALSNLDKKLEPTNSRLSAVSSTLNAGAPVGTKTVDKQGDTQRDAVVDATKQVRLATAIYPTASLLNHSCEPNIIASFEGAVLTMRATRDIEPGEEILHCYGPHAKHLSREERQRALQEQYFFTCACRACAATPADELETCDWSNAFACRKCSHPLMHREGKKKVGTCVNSNCRQTQSLRDLLKEKERAGNLFKLSQHFLEQKHVEECLAILHQCYKIQREILYKHHKALAETQDCLAQCYSHMGDFKTAGKYLRQSLETVEKLYGSESIELANELHKLAQVLFNGGEVQDTLAVVNRAIKLLVLHYGPNHSDVLELNQMKSCLLSIET